MRKRVTTDFIVGLTVILCIVVVIAATMWVNQTDIRGHRSAVLVRFRDVGNVRVGSPVVIRGVQSGRVEGVELAEGGWVRMRLRLEEGVALPRDPVVLLNAASLFGEWQATITSREAIPQNPEVRQQIAEASEDDAMLPGAILPDIAQLTTVAGGIAGNVASVAERVKVAFDDRAAVALRTSINNVATLSTELTRTVNRQSRSLDSLSVDVHRGVIELRATAESFRHVAARIDSSTSRGEVRSIVGDLAHAARELDQATRQVRVLTDRVERSHALLDRVITRTDSVMTKVNGGSGTLGLMVNDASLYHRSDSLLVQLQALVADVKANPRRYFTIRIF